MCKSSSLFDLCLPFDLVGTGGVGAVSRRFIWSEVQREEISMYLYLTRTFFYRYWQQRKQPQTLLWLPGLKFLVVLLWAKFGFPEPILRLWEMQHWYISGEEGGPQWTIKTHTAPRWPDSPCQNVTIVSQNTLDKYPTFWTKEYMKTWNLNKKVVKLATFLFLSCPFHKHTLKMESENKRLNLWIVHFGENIHLRFTGDPWKFDELIAKRKSYIHQQRKDHPRLFYFYHLFIVLFGRQWLKRETLSHFKMFHENETNWWQSSKKLSLYCCCTELSIDIWLFTNQRAQEAAAIKLYWPFTPEWTIFGSAIIGFSQWNLSRGTFCYSSWWPILFLHFRHRLSCDVWGQVWKLQFTSHRIYML